MFTNEVSCLKVQVRAELNLSSALMLRLWSASRACFICSASRSVGVGVEASGMEGGVFVSGSVINAGLGVVLTAGWEYIDFFLGSYKMSVLFEAIAGHRSVLHHLWRLVLLRMQSVSE